MSIGRHYQNAYVTRDVDKAVASFPPEKFAGVVFNRRP